MNSAQNSKVFEEVVQICVFPETLEKASGRRRALWIFGENVEKYRKIAKLFVFLG